MKLGDRTGGETQRTSAAGGDDCAGRVLDGELHVRGPIEHELGVTPVSRMKSCGVPPCSAGAALRAHAAAVKPWSAAADPSSESEYLPPATNGALKCNSTGRAHRPRRPPARLGRSAHAAGLGKSVGDREIPGRLSTRGRSDQLRAARRGGTWYPNRAPFPARRRPRSSFRRGETSR